MAEDYAKRLKHEARNNRPNGGAVGSLRKCKLWTGVAHAVFEVQQWNLYTLMRLLMPNNFYALTFDLWPLLLPQFWIIWKTVKIYLLLGFSRNLHKTFFYMNFGPMRSSHSGRIFFKAKHYFLIIHSMLQFYANYSSASNSYMQSDTFMAFGKYVEG